jgi:hypothetical protein
LTKFFVVAAIGVVCHGGVEWSCSVDATAVFGMNPGLFAEVAIEAVLFLLEAEAIFLFALLLAELVLEGRGELMKI